MSTQTPTSTRLQRLHDSTSTRHNVYSDFNVYQTLMSTLQDSTSTRLQRLLYKTQRLPDFNVCLSDFNVYSDSYVYQTSTST
ncbi:unnamed protein product [Bursaphelenchus okinawaensis]|uniref:Uncharacterized protein n=1 Tax=Bursaphelenchus okinawaensis TaxID=465554 RepID=A0A811KFE7_9BILA|nr:unnamed protein product [Bursaphelenchus okinawaensis]CAG9102907.1 unnamed protein product [Bursaphelenchus okinawaensis]